MLEIRKLDHNQLERKLTEVAAMGQQEDYTEENVKQIMRIERETWEDAVKTTLADLKGIGEKRKELFMEYLKERLREAGICIR